MDLPPDLEMLTETLTLLVFYLIWAAVTLTWVFQIALHPSNRQEWAEFCKITAFEMIMTRTIVLIAADNVTIPQPWALLFWVIVAIFVGFYLYVLLDMWGIVVFGGVCGWCIQNRSKTFVIAIIVLSLVAMAASFRMGLFSLGG